MIEAVSSDQHLHHEQHDHHRQRVKRENLHETTENDGVHLVLIYETSGGKCGLQSQNRKRLYAPDLHEKTIKLQQETPVQHSQYSSTTTAEDRESNIN